MTILFDAARKVKPARPFAAGLSFARRADHTAADARWWAENSPANRDGFHVTGPSDAALELAAGAALAEDRMSAGYAVL
jgi:hypothetical protein